MRPARLAITAVFALNGAMFASLYSRLPGIQDRTGIGDGELGLALLCGMLGLMSVQLVTGALVTRLGSRPVVLASAIGYALGLVPVALSTSFGALCASMFLIGMASGVLDVSMNVHGLTVERQLGRPVLSTMHAAFSFGALGGAAVGSIVAGAEVGVVSHLCVVAAFGVGLALVLHGVLLPPEADAVMEGPRWARPTRALALIGAFAVCVVLSEGSVADWAAVYLDSEAGASEGVAAIGLAAFSLTMGIGRLSGDRLSAGFGAERFARGGALLAAFGIGLALLADTPLPAIGGFLIAGLGLSALFPLALRAAAERGESPGPAVAGVSALGYIGFIAGPPAIGGLAELFGLRAAMLLIVACLTTAAALAGAVRTPAVARSR